MAFVVISPIPPHMDGELSSVTFFLRFSGCGSSSSRVKTFSTLGRSFDSFGLWPFCFMLFSISSFPPDPP